jgi:hypothetical protein
MVFWRHFQLYFNLIVAVSFISGGNPSAGTILYLVWYRNIDIWHWSRLTLEKHFPKTVSHIIFLRGRHGHDRMVVGFTTVFGKCFSSVNRDQCQMSMLRYQTRYKIVPADGQNLISVWATDLWGLFSFN